MYDAYGHARMDGGMGGFGGFHGGQQMSPEDIFNAFEQAFGGGLNFGRQRSRLADPSAHKSTASNIAATTARRMGGGSV